MHERHVTVLMQQMWFTELLLIGSLDGQSRPLQIGFGDHRFPLTSFETNQVFLLHLEFKDGVYPAALISSNNKNKSFSASLSFHFSGSQIR